MVRVLVSTSDTLDLIPIFYSWSFSFSYIDEAQPKNNESLEVSTEKTVETVFFKPCLALQNKELTTYLDLTFLLTCKNLLLVTSIFT